MGTAMVAMLLAACAGCSGASPRSRPAALLAFGPTYLYFSALRPRGHLHRVRSRSRCWWSIFRFLDRPRRYHPALIGALLALVASRPRRRRSSRSSWSARSSSSALAIPRHAPAQLLRPGHARRLGGVGVGAGRVRRRLHDPLHDVPHAPGGALGRHLRPA